MIVLLLGSDMGDREDLLNKACALIEAGIGRITLASSIYESEAWGFSSDTLFLNQVVCLDNAPEPQDLLEKVQQIESQLGRERTGLRYSSRSIDIDILFYDNRVISTERLVIPHPRLHQRSFTLIPLNEILSEMVHPLLNKTVRELLYVCEDDLKVRKYTGD